MLGVSLRRTHLGEVVDDSVEHLVGAEVQEIREELTHEQQGRERHPASNGEDARSVQHAPTAMLVVLQRTAHRGFENPVSRPSQSCL